MKKIIVLCAAFAVAFTCLSGCGDTKTGTNGEKLETLTWYVPIQEQEDSDLVVEEANKIIEPAIGATLDIKFIDTGAYSERMKMNMASGTAYDLCFTSHWTNNFLSAVENGSLYDISDLISDELKSAIPDYALEAAKIDGMLYAIPNVQVMTNPLSVKAQKSLLEKYNFDLSTVKTIEDIEPFLAIIKENEPDLFPYRTLWGIEPWVYPYYSGSGGSGTTNVFVKKDGDGKTFELKHMTPEFKRGHEVLREWYKKGYIRQDVASVGSDSTDSKMGKYAVEIDSWAPGVEALQAANGIEWVFQPLHEPFMTMSGPRAAMTAVGVDSKNPELAVKLIELVNLNTELYNLLCYGIEGQHYTFNDEHKMVISESKKYSPKSDWVFGNQFNAYILEGADDSVWEETENMNNSAKLSPIFTFEEDISSYKSEVSQIASVNSEYSPTNAIVLESDEEFEKFFEDYNAKLEAAGQQKVLDELQKQLDEYWKNK